MMKLPLPPTEEQHTMDTGSAFSQGKGVARQLLMISLPGALERAAKKVAKVKEVAGEAAEDVHGIASRYGTNLPSQSTAVQAVQAVQAVHIPSRRTQSHVRRAGIAGVFGRPAACAWRSGMEGSGRSRRPHAPDDGRNRGTVGYPW